MKLTVKNPSELYRKEAIEKGPITTQDQPQIFGRNLITLLPLMFELLSLVREGRRHILHDMSHELVRLFNRASRLIDKLRWKRGPSLAKILHRRFRKQRHQLLIIAAHASGLFCGRLLNGNCGVAPLLRRCDWLSVAALRLVIRFRFPS